MSIDAGAGPGLIGRIRSRQAGRPSGLLGRIIGRAMVAHTASANDEAIGLLGVEPGARVLEIGFGQGRTVERLVAAGHRVIGVEVAPTMLRQARARNRVACRDGRAQLMLGDGTLLPLDDHSVDAAISVHTVYFMPDPARTLTEVARVLRPGGPFVLACRVADDPPPEWMDPSIYRIRPADEIVKLLEAAGFNDVSETVRPEVSEHTRWFRGLA